MSISPNVPMQQYRGPEATMPTSALEGQILITTDTDKMFVGKGPGVAPKQIGGATYTQTITTASTTWNVIHNLGKRPSVTTVNTDGQTIEGQVVYNSDNQITIYFSPAIAGTVYLN
jgi:hypothetical protein